MVCVSIFFMLDTQDIQVLREMFGESEARMIGRIDSVRDEMIVRIDGTRDETVGRMDGMRDEMVGRIDSVRDEMIGRIDGVRDEMIVRIDGARDETVGRMDNIRDEILKKMHEELRSVRNDIIEVINDGVLPQIDRLNIRVTRLERMQRQSSF